MDEMIVLKDRLLECASQFDSAELFPALTPEASRFVVSDPYAFVIACCLDRGTKADIIWTIPFYLKEYLGHLDPLKIFNMSVDELVAAFKALPKRPRYVNDAPRTLVDLTRIVVEECGGDAAGIWQGKKAAEVKQTFMSVHGVGNGIANMSVLLIEKAFPVKFDDADRRGMDIKPDVHTKRVLYRLGVSAAVDDYAALDAARRISPDWPGAIDGGLWFIGRTWCSESVPTCSQCCMRDQCKRVGVSDIQ